MNQEISFIGNTRIISRLRAITSKGKLSHAYLFSGPEHCGKFLLARYFAEALSEGKRSFDVSGTCSSVYVYIVEPECIEKKGVKKQRSIDIEHIRDLQKIMSMSPLPGAYRVCIINDAHMLTLQAQNALLKIVEEPPKRSIIMIVTHRSGSLLSTLISRCQNIIFSVPSFQEARSFLQYLSLSSADFASAWKLALGRPGLFVRMLQDESYRLKRLKSREIIESIFSASLRERLLIGEQLAQDGTYAEEFLLLWIYLMRDNGIKYWKNGISGIAQYQCIERISAAVEALKTTNANARLILENLLISG